MRELKTTKTFRADTEKEAIVFIQQEKDNSMDGAYTITKASYVYKTKKTKEGPLEGYQIDITYTYQGLWDDLLGDD